MDDVKIGEILSGSDENDRAEQERDVRHRFWQTLKRAAGHVPFMEDLVASYYCAMDPATPTRVRGTLLAALAYFVLPLDFVPDFIALIGFTDDIAVLAAAISAIRAHIKPAHYDAAREALRVDPDLTTGSSRAPR
ncbi:YkvA family protein [Pararhizobium haloflavum]|uniref:YkvA family protein n=1 Tax=Pararhizobium haloflavum TaxID=2037914 RepID=UPI000C1A0C40|nr:YkvA family protein [Pararhizobium haloflavum]